MFYDGKTTGNRLRLTRCRPRQNKDSRRVGGHAPPQRHLERSAATTKTRFTGRKQNKRKRILLSSRPSSLSPVKIKIPVASADMRRHSDTLRGAQRRRKRGLRGENRISVSEFCCLPVLLLCLPVRQHLTQRPQSAPNTPH